MQLQFFQFYFSTPDGSSPSVALGIVVALVMAWLSDGWLKGRRWPLPVLNSTFVIGVAIALLVVGIIFTAEAVQVLRHHILISGLSH